MARFVDIIGTVNAYIKIGLSGVRLKNSSGNLLIRNTGDSADAAVTASAVNISGESLVINSDAAGSAADWAYTISRPTSGMTAAVTFTLPVDDGMTAAVTFTLPVDDGTPNQVLATDGSGVLSWASAASTASSDKIDTTSLAFGTSSPLSLFTTGAADIITMVEVIIDTAFDGTPSLSIGISGTTSKYAASTQIDLTMAAGTSFAIYPNKSAQGAEALIATYSAGSATAGAARILVYYATPA